MQNYARLSAYRLSEVFVSTVMVITYLINARSNSKALDSDGKPLYDSSFLDINLFYLLGRMAEVLSYEYNKNQGIFNMAE